MREVDVPRERVHADPLDRLLLVPGLAERSSISELGWRCRCRRRPGGIPCRSASTECPARRRPPPSSGSTGSDLVLAGVDVVAEEDRLARALEGRRIRRGQHDAWRSRRLLGPGRPFDDRERDDGCRTRTQRYPSRLPHYRFTAQGRTDRANAAADRRGTDKSIKLVKKITRVPPKHTLEGPLRYSHQW